MALSFDYPEIRGNLVMIIALLNKTVAIQMSNEHILTVRAKNPNKHSDAVGVDINSPVPHKMDPNRHVFELFERLCKELTSSANSESEYSRSTE